MTEMLDVLGYLFMILIVCAMSAIIVVLIREADFTFDKGLRAFAASIGFALYYASKGADISVPELVLLSIDNSGGIIGGIMRTLLPAMIGSLMTFIFLSSIGRMCKENDKAIYFMLTLMSLVLFVFTDVFFTGIGAKQPGRHMLINTSFVIGVGLTILYNVDLLKSLRTLVGRRQRVPHTDAGATENVTGERWQDKL